jgi:ABC-type transport system substrate-binding protein
MGKDEFKEDQFDEGLGQVVHPRFSRRSFLAKAGMGSAAVVAAAWGGPSLLAGTEAAASSPSDSPLAYPRNSETLLFGMQTTIPGLDPHKWWNGAVQSGTQNIFETLITLDPYTLKYVPGLSALPVVTNGGTRYTFNLRKGVKFHNGQLLTAEDVKYSFERMLNPKFAAQAASLYYLLPIKGLSGYLNDKANAISGITVPDASTVVFDLEHPESTMLAMISYLASSIVPKTAAEQMGFNKFNWSPIGTGPFKAQVVNPTEHIRLVRNDSYWQPGIPRFAAVDWTMGISPSLSVLRIESGSQDLMYEQPSEGVLAGIMANPRTKNQVVIGPAAENLLVTLSLKVPELRDLRVRQAIAMAINRTRVVQEMHGLARVADGGMYMPGTPWYQPGIAYQYNPSKAKALLTEAGYAKGFTIPMWSDEQDIYTIAGQIIQQDLAAIGVTAQYKPMSYDAFVEFSNPGPPGLLVWAWGMNIQAGSYIVDSAFTTSSITAGCCNYSHYSSSTLDALTLDAHQTASQTKAISLYKQMDKIVTEQALWVTVCYPYNIELISKRVLNYRNCFYGGGDVGPYFYKLALS